MMNFMYNGHHLGLLQIGGPGDNNSNVACGGGLGCGIWWNVTAYTNPGQINWYYREDVSCPDGRGRGCI